jgi:hypothetical protein
MDEAAYAPMADGDGPFAVITRVRRGIESLFLKWPNR